VQQLARVGRSV